MNFRNLVGGALFVGTLAGGAYLTLKTVERETQYVWGDAKAVTIPCDSFVSADSCKNAAVKGSKVDTVLKHVKKPTMKLLK